MKSGFTLVEILVAIAISGLLAMVLMGTFFQVNISTQLVTDRVDMQMRASVLFHQLEKDVRGAYIPSSVLAALHTSEQKKEANKEKDKELVPQVFVSKNGAGGMLEQVTFITDNPLVVYWGETVGKPHQRRARVTYRVHVEPEEGLPVAYRLVRYESADFTKIPDEAQTGIEVANDIKSITVTYRARVKEESEEKSDEKEKKQEKIEERDTWNTDEQIASNKENERVHLPDLMVIAIALWTEDRQYAETSSYVIPLEIDSVVIPAAVQKRKPVQKKEDKEDKKKDKKEKSEEEKFAEKFKIKGKILGDTAKATAKKPVSQKKGN